MKFNNKNYFDIFQLAQDMYLDSDYFARELRQENLLAFIKENDEKKFEKIQKLSLLSLPDDVFVFKASFILNPFMSFRINGFVFDDYQKLGAKMLSFAPEPNPILTLLIRYSLISEHMKNTYYFKDHLEIYEETLRIEKLSEKDLIYAYFMMGYHLSQKKTIYYKGIEYQDIFNLTYFLCKQENDLESLGDYLSKSPLLKAYIDYAKDSRFLMNYIHLCYEVDHSETLLKRFLQKRKHYINSIQTTKE